MSKLALGKKKELEIKLPKFAGWITETAREFEKNIYFCFIDSAKAFDWITINCGKLLERYEYHHLTCCLRNLYVGQEATVRTLYGTTDWFTIENGLRQGCLLSPCFLIYILSTS